MLRDTQIYPMTNNTAAGGGRNVGMEWLWQELREPLEGDQLPHGIAHPSGSPYPYRTDGWRNPGGPQNPNGPASRLESEVRYLWAPTLISVSAKVRAPDGSVSTDPTAEVLIDFIPYDTFQAAKDPSAANYLALAAAPAKQPIAGFRSGQVGGRLVFASNAGHGYRFPRQANTGNRSCTAGAIKVFALSMTHNIPDDGSVGFWITDFEWKLEQV